MRFLFDRAIFTIDMAKKKLKTTALNYRVLIEKESYEDGTPVYVTHVPALGVSDYGLTVEEALANTEKLIKFHVECLIDEGEAVPAPDDLNTIFVTTSQVEIAPKKRFAFA